MNTKRTLMIIFLIMCITLSFFTILPVSKAQVVGSGSIDSGLVGYWRFDESLGTSAFDSSGNSHNGTLVNGASWVTGVYGNSLSLDGVNDRFSVADNSVFRFNNFSLSIWYFIASASGGSGTNRNLFVKGDYWDANMWALYNTASSPSTFIFATRVNNGVVKSFTFSSGLSGWVHIVVVKDSLNSTLYLNSVYACKGEADADLSSVTAPLEVSGVDRVSGGKFDDVRLYNRTLSVSEISSLYSGFYVSVSNDIGSTVLPNGSVKVGVDQLVSFGVGVVSGFVPWSFYLDNVVYAPSAVVNFYVQSNRSLYVTSQYVGGVYPTYPVQIPTIQINYINIIMILFFFGLNLLLMIKRIPLISFIVTAFTLIISLIVFLPDTSIIGHPYLTVFLMLFSTISLLLNTLQLFSPQK